MDKIILTNGLTVIFNVSNRQPEVSVTFKTGHINEPKLGVAAVYENVVQQVSARVLSIFGGSLTSFVTGATEGSVEDCFRNMRKWCVDIDVTPELVEKAVKDIVKHTEDMAPLALRQTKLAYKHTAFSHNWVYWSPEEYIRLVSELTAEDVKSYIKSCFTGRNVVLGFYGKREHLNEVITCAEKYFGSLPRGERSELNNLLYTGGSMEIKGDGNTNIAMFGWDLSDCNTPETNVLMSMLSARLERSICEAGVVASYEVKIAGYFGLRTLRITVNCANEDDFRKCIDIVCHNVNRLLTSEASQRRLETSRQRAMCERLAVSNEALPRSVEAAWALLGRNINYDADEVITDIWQISARDVKDAARKIFTKNMTCVMYTKAKHRCYNSIIAQMMK